MKKRKKIFLVLLGESSEKKVKRKNPRGDKRFSRLKTKAAPNGASSLSKWRGSKASLPNPQGEITPEEFPVPKTKQPMWARREYAYKRAMKDSTMDTDEGIRRRYRVITGDPKPDPKPPVSSQKHPADGKAFDRKKGVYVDTALAEVRRDYHRKLS